MQRYKLTLSYDGTSFSGWQIQPNGVTIQGKIQEALCKLLREEVHVVGSGRTDAGVHAKGQVAHFSWSHELPEQFLNHLRYILAPEIAAIDLETVSNDFHARFSAKQKTYHYYFATSRHLSPFEWRYLAHLSYTMDFEKLQKALPYFIGTHDFTSFANERGEPFSPIKTLHTLNLIQEGEGRFRFEFTGDGFLYKMVRNIVGTLIWIARGKIPLESLPELFKAKNRSLLPPPAPAKGLFLISVDY